MARESVLAYAAEHPAFAGHFPGAPIVPGVLLLDAALNALATESGHAVAEIASAKFLQPVMPDQPVSLLIERDPSGRARFEMMSGAQRVASGQLLLR